MNFLKPLAECRERLSPASNSRENGGRQVVSSDFINSCVKFFTNMSLNFATRCIQLTRFFNTIRYGLSAVFCCVIITLTILTSVIYYNYQKDYSLNLVRTKALNISKSLAINSAPHIMSDDKLQLSTLISTEGKKPDVIGVGILDRSGRVILHSDISNIGRVISAEDQTGVEEDLSTKKSILTLEPIIINGRAIGSVVLEMSLTSLLNRNNNLRLILLSAVSLFTIICCILAVFIIDFFIRPLKALDRAAARVGQGELSTRIQEKGGEEIQSLSRTFNEMVSKLSEANSRIEEGYLQSVMMLSATVEAKDPYTRGHCDRVAYYAEKIARHMGIDDDSVKQLQLAAQLHDIGKIGVNESILGKQGSLTDSEFSQMSNHPAIAWNILKPATFLLDVRGIIVEHHEKFNGKGYPQGLSGHNICLTARILAMADTYDAMTTNRPYRKSLSKEKAISIIKQESGKQFDPLVVEAFLVVQKYLEPRESIDEHLRESNHQGFLQENLFVDNSILTDLSVSINEAV